MTYEMLDEQISNFYLGDAEYEEWLDEQWAKVHEPEPSDLGVNEDVFYK